MTTVTQVGRRAGEAARTLTVALAGRGTWVILAAAIFIAVTGNAYLQTITAEALILGVAALGFNIVLGDTGTFSLAGATAFGVGAYTYALLLNHNWNVWLSVLLTIIVSAVLSALVGILTLRLQVAYLAIATFAVAEIVLNLMSELSFTGAAAGLQVNPTQIFGHMLDSATSTYDVILGVLALAILLHRWLITSSLGRQFNAVRDDELAASALGLGVFRTRMVSLIIGGTFAAVAGVLYCLVIPYLDPSILSADESVLLLVMIVVGGMGTTIGPVIGAIVLTVIPQAFQFLEVWWQLIYGAVILLAVLAGSDGIVGWCRAGYAWLRRLVAGTAVRRHLAVGRLLPAVRSGADIQAGTDAGARDSFPFPVEPSADPAVLELRSVTKRFGGLAAVREVSLTCRPGTVHALIGPNGAGKSTIVNLLTGIYPPDGGSIQLGGTRLNGLGAHQIARLGVARTFQTPHPFAEMTVLDNMVLAVEQNGGRRAEARKRAQQYLAAAGLSGVAGNLAGSIPHGQQRLMEIARALAGGPKMLILDEPAGGLSEGDVARLGALLKGLAEQGIGVLVIEHNMAFVMGNATVVSVLNAGRLIAEGSVAEVVNNPDVRAAYLGEHGSGIDLGVTGPTAGGAGPPDAGEPAASAGDASMPHRQAGR
jgi:ABC-type branched-subunit amino acid transport system ATPase component/ABC-type branched-subunit amino acid transport system permease subunit